MPHTGESPGTRVSADTWARDVLLEGTKLVNVTQLRKTTHEATEEENL